MTRAKWNRLILIADPSTHHIVDVCSGPTVDGSCPRPDGDLAACHGAVLLPATGTEANGHAIPVGAEARLCPAAFISGPEAEAS